MKRRELLGSVSAAPALGLVRPSIGREGSEPDVPSQRAILSAAQWRTLAAVQDHLLPSEPEAPGAREVHATYYLDRALAVPGFDADIRRRILDGIGWLDELAQQRHRTAFPRLEPGPREDLLRQVARTGAGERWLSTLITYTVEALLADPLYGGNPDGIGWAWLGHDPGLPRPTPDNIHGRLGRT
jgi:gluconate 2-dehydrogenase gamma chain